MGQHATHVFVGTSGDTGPTQGDLQEIFESPITGGTPVTRLLDGPGVKGASKPPRVH